MLCEFEIPNSKHKTTESASFMKAITFDFWNTLFLDRHEEVRHAKRIAFAYERLKRYRPALPIEEVEAAFLTAHELFVRQWEDKKAFTMSRHVQEITCHLGLEVPPDQFLAIVDYFESILLEHPPLIVGSAVEAVRFACSRMMVGLISDTGYSPGKTLRRILEQHQLEDSFHAFSFSNETGFLKPSPECFWKILTELNVQPAEAVHIGDLEDTDIAGAKLIGMKAIKYVGSNLSETRESIADAVIEDFSELPAALSCL